MTTLTDIVLRASKGVQFTIDELDANLTFLKGSVGSIPSGGGWWKTPTGIIFQFIPISAPTQATTTFPLPIAFPQFAFTVLALKGIDLTLSGEHSLGGTANTTTFTITNTNTNPGAAQGVMVLVIGW